MGFPMAMNVRRKMDRSAILYVYDVFQANCVRFKENLAAEWGPIEIATSPKNVAENAMTIVSIVPAASHVREVYLDEITGVIAARDGQKTDKNRSRLYVECSTIDIDTAKSVGQQLEQSDMGVYVDSPVSVSHRNNVRIIFFRATIMGKELVTNSFPITYREASQQLSRGPYLSF